MSETRTNAEKLKRYEQFGIDKNRFMELKYVARQYDRMKRDEAKLRLGEVDRPEHTGNSAWKQPDPTGNAAVGFVMRSNADKIRAIEEAAKQAATLLPVECDATWKHIMQSVTRGIAFEKLCLIYCDRKVFLRARRWFYIELDRRLP